jgi:hypothetical protein
MNQQVDQTQNKTGQEHRMFAHHSDRMAKRRLIHPKANEKSTKPKGDLGAA